MTEGDWKYLRSIKPELLEQFAHLSPMTQESIKALA